MAYVLRHGPEKYNLALDSQGFVCLDSLAKELGVSVITIENVVKSDSKNRYVIKDRLIRANQGHSTKGVELNFKAVTLEDVPRVLYHGTKQAYLESIELNGLVPGSRQYVHLSGSKDSAIVVANRRAGSSIILEIDGLKLLKAGSLFVSENGVYLAKTVDFSCVDKVNFIKS